MPKVWGLVRNLQGGSYRGRPRDGGEIVELGQSRDGLLIQQGRIELVKDELLSLFVGGQPPYSCGARDCESYFLNEAAWERHYARVHKGEVVAVEGELAEARAKVADADARIVAIQQERAEAEAAIPALEERLLDLASAKPVAAKAKVPA
jgi:hypothetical protein